jgi:hypothetical protein
MHGIGTKKKKKKGKKYCFYDGYSTDVEAVTHALMKTKVSNFVLFCSCTLGYSFKQVGTVTTDIFQNALLFCEWGRRQSLHTERNIIPCVRKVAVHLGYGT